MPLIKVVLSPGSSGTEVGELHKQLTEIGAVIAPGEQSAKNFGPTTAAAVRKFRALYGLDPGAALEKSTARLMHAASVFAGSGNRAGLRSAVREVANAADASQPQEIYQLARFAILASDYPMARSIALRAPGQQQIEEIVLPILELLDQVVQPSPAGPPVAPQPRPPEVPYPENFYTCRHDLYPLDALNEMQRQISAVKESDANGPDPGPDAGRGRELIQAAASWFEAIKQWQAGNAAQNRRQYTAAQAAYDACQSAACEYFAGFYGVDLGGGGLTDRLTNLIKHLGEIPNTEAWEFLWSSIIWRRGLLSLEELRAWDFFEHSGKLDNLFIPLGHAPASDPGLRFIQFYFHRRQNPDPEIADPGRANRQNALEAPLITIAFVLVPLARAEANRARRRFDAAIGDLRWVLDSVVVRRIFPTLENPGPIRSVFARLACEFIELPFARLLLAETLLDKADAEYKARIVAEPAPAPDVSGFQGLKAAQTYLSVKDAFKGEGAYVANVEAATNELMNAIEERLTANDTRSEKFRLLGKDIHIPVFASSSAALPGLDRRAKAHEPLLRYTLPEGQAPRETNLRVYAALLTAAARLEQLKAGFNYLGYLDSYVPPWRFQFLLERARYFAEHAKNAQREYLNFLSNAEREEFQELSAAQNVEMEKSNVRIETARVDQSTLEVAAAQQSQELAELAKENAQKRLDRFKKFDEYADSLFGTTGGDDALEIESRLANGIPAELLLLSSSGSSALVGANAGLTALGDRFTGGAISGRKQVLLADQQREFERFNLELAAEESAKSAEIAATQVAAAQAGLVVAGLQRQAALLRHEFALQNLQFLRNRTLNAEQWYRLSAAIRGVSETYLRYSVELAFLAEQAYEFEADKRINVIRFDYDLSEVGDFLAADFLLRDLDTLEQDMIVMQRQRQQHVRYVLSMAREFPEALQEIRDTGRTIFSLRLEQLEKRFPGLFNLRIGAVDVLPLALMDSTRFSLDLTHLGTSQVRLKAQPDTPPGVPSASPLNINDLPVPAGEWLAELQEMYPVKLRVTGPETTVFSGLTRQEASAVFAFASAGQRQAYESLGAAAAWQVDFTARENQVVPGTLADLLITLTLSGYHDPELRRAIDRAPRTTTAATRLLSGQTTFPDALYEFNRSGLMTWNVTRDLLTVTDTLGAVRNVAVLLRTAPGRLNYYGRLVSRCEVRVRITSTGDLEVLSEIPHVTFTFGDSTNQLSLTAQATLPPGAEISWDFGDGSARQVGANQQHSYARAGRYAVTLRVVRNGRLLEFRADVVVSRAHFDRLSPPLTAFPTLTRETGTDIPSGHTRVVGTLNTPADDPAIAIWRVGARSGQKSNRATFDLKPGDYSVFFTAVRPLRARVYCSQRQHAGPAFDFNGLSLASNRRFDLNGTEITGGGDNPPANPMATHFFTNGALSPADEWTVELPLSDNPFLRSVGATDVEQYDLAEIQDAILALEYETTPGGP
jgi:hypothetical protein